MSKKNRPSPSDSATNFKVGTKKKGNDGNFWIIKENVKGTHRWVRVDGKKKISSSIKSKKQKTSNKIVQKSKYYYIHDNGGRPLMVEDQGGSVTIWGVTDHGEEKPQNYQNMIMNLSYRKIFIPKPSKTKFDLGNIILLEIKKHEYVYIGDRSIDFFKTKEPIDFFMSNIGNSDVAYAYALSEKHAYLLSEKTLMDRSHFPASTQWKLDVYGEYYEMERAKNKAMPAKKIPGLRRIYDVEARKFKGAKLKTSKVSKFEQIFVSPKKIKPSQLAKDSKKIGGPTAGFSEVLLWDSKAKEKSLEDFLGKPTIIAFFDSENIPESVFYLDCLSRISKSLGKNKVHIIAVPTENDVDQRIYEPMKLPFDMYMHPEALIHRYFKPKRQGATILIDSAGVVKKKFGRYRRDDEKKLLKEIKALR